jgi:phosphoribosylanthranilate isomerase
MDMPGRTRIKICGVRSAEIAVCAAEAGADAIGLVFHPSSVRFIEPEEAAAIIGCLPPFILSVGVFVNASTERFLDIEEVCPTHLSQLQGNEDEETVRECGPDIIKAVRFDAATIASELSRWDAVEEVGAILVDGSAGGQGKPFDWSALTPHVAGVSKRIIVAGGLTPANVGEAIRAVRPWAVDVSSGVESAPGVKEPRLIEEFCAAVRQADAD